MDTLEYKVLYKLSPYLILCIEQSPDDIFVNLRPSGILAPGDVSFLQNPMNSKLDKAQRIANVVLTQVQLNTQVFAQFIEAMKASGDWTVSTVHRIEEEYKSFAVTTSPLQEDSEDPTVDRGAQASCLANIGTSKSTHFEFLHVSELSEDKKTDLKYRLMKDTQEIVVEFGTLLTDIEDSLVEQNIPLRKIKSFILNLRAFTYNLAVKVLDEADKKKIKNANEVSDIFDVLREYVSFFNYHIIQYIIKKFGTSKDHERLQTYFEYFHGFCKRSIFEIPPDLFSSGSSVRKTAMTLVFKLLEEEITLEDVQKVIGNISSIFQMEPSALKLCYFETGCVELHFLISAAVADHILPASPSQLSALSEIGVRVLSCEGVEQTSREETEPQNKEFHSASPVHTHSVQQMETRDDKKLNNITQHFGVVDEQLDTECSDEDLEHFGRHLVGYIEYANALGLSQADITEIDVDKEIADDITLKLTAALKKWKSVCKFSTSLATYRCLLRVAIKLEDGEGAEEICEQIKHSVSYNKSFSPGPSSDVSSGACVSDGFESIELTCSGLLPRTPSVRSSAGPGLRSPVSTADTPPCGTVWSPPPVSAAHQQLPAVPVLEAGKTFPSLISIQQQKDVQALMSPGSDLVMYPHTQPCGAVPSLPPVSAHQQGLLWFPPEQMHLASAPEEPILEGVITRSSGVTGSRGTQAEDRLVKTYGVSSEQLNTEIKEGDMIILARYFDNVEFYLSTLELPLAEQIDVKQKASTHGNQIAMNHALLLWKQNNPSRVTLRILLQNLTDLGKENIALNICKFYFPMGK